MANVEHFLVVVPAPDSESCTNPGCGNWRPFGSELLAVRVVLEGRHVGVGDHHSFQVKATVAYKHLNSLLIHSRWQHRNTGHGRAGQKEHWQGKKAAAKCGTK